MKSAIECLRAALPCPLYANRTEDLKECVIYDFYTTGWDGVKRSVVLKLHIYAGTMERGMALEEMADRALVTLGDRPLTGTVLSVRRNGGGWLTNGDMHCRMAWYEMTIRDIQEG